MDVEGPVGRFEASRGLYVRVRWLYAFTPWTGSIHDPSERHGRTVADCATVFMPVFCLRGLPSGHWPGALPELAGFFFFRLPATYLPQPNGVVAC